MTDPARSAPQAAPPPRPGPQPPPSAPGPLFVPARRLAPSPAGDRRLRRLTTLVGAVIVVLVVLGLALASTATWLAGRGYGAVPAATGLGTPSALVLDLRVGDVRVLPSADVDELTLALVEPGETTLPASDEQVPARLSESSAGGRTTVEVRQPSRTFGPPWADGGREVLLLVPTDLELALEVRTRAGDVRADGEFTALDVHSDAGDLRLGPLTAPDGVSARTGAGDIDLELVSPAPTAVDVLAATGDVDVLLPTDAGGRVAVAADVGDIEVAAPGTGRWQVQAESAVGDVRTAPGLEARSGERVGTLTVTSEVGSIDITR